MGAPKDYTPEEWVSARRLGDSDVYWLPMSDKIVVWHWCTQTTTGQPPRWDGSATSNHQHLSLDPLHLEPSLACADCDWHGFIRDGQWVPV